MSRFNFRIKIDLRNFYNDVRRFCWIFVEGTKMLQVSHLKMHITKMFNIKEPFHLLLNDTEYLPPDEDIRILRENETILVCLGSGLEDTTEMSANTTIQSELQNNFSISQKPKDSVQNNFSIPSTNEISITSKATSTPIKQISQKLLVQQKNKAKLPNEVLNSQQIDTLDSSTCDDNLSETETKNKSSTRNDSTTNNSEVRPKRRRIRTRKRNRNQEAKEKVQEKDNDLKRLKIISSCILPRSKHIYFDNVLNVNNIKNVETQQEKTHETCTNPVPSAELAHSSSLGQHETCTNPEPPAVLANLLLLREHPEPATFTNTIVKEETKLDNEKSDEKLQIKIPADSNIPMELVREFQEGKQLSINDIIESPVIANKPQPRDVIAFRILKIGEDYTPQVSALIVAKVISCCEKEQMYTFRVMQGMSEMNEPIGKFTLESDEDQTTKDNITVDFAQLIEPRLIYTDMYL